MNAFIIISVFCISFLLTFFFRKIAIKKSIFDLPNERSSHSIPTPRTGGISIAILWYIYLLFDIFLFQQLNTLSISFLLCLPLTIISLVDDFISVKPIYRFLVQFLCVMALWLNIYLSNYKSEYTFLIISIISLVIIFSGIWFINLYNFLDGIDGYAATQAIIFFLVSYFITKEFFLIVLTAIVLGFLIWNWHPAKIFMGDTGSTLLGFIILSCSIYFHISHKQSILISLTFTSVFWFDASVTLLRRILNKEKISIAHRKHAYQRFVQSGLKHYQVTLLLLGIYICLFTIYLIMIENSAEYFILISSVTINILFYLYAEKRLAFNPPNN